MPALVRPAEARDHARWRELFDAYTRFSEREPDEAIAKHAWDRILDPASPVKALVAEHDGRVAEMKRQRWAKLYWSTRENNYRARALYDQYTPHSGFLRYVINNPDA